ncbi:MAG TPA: alpha/beta hydrolase [Methylomusa anaerophila]|uniref:hypothetical protein n=1 Tax=Methylomusa anaerophila TaxID=1930071 RepID=UPI000F821A53|nr:hypothetical protein [Methylomusa anaerophila]HML87946.1 alpha/beta hydrolase [Methylomusa anaerophila]
MNKLLAEIIDKSALYQLHRNKSKTWQFSNIGSIPTLEDVHHYYFQPQIPEISFEHVSNRSNYKIGNFRYKSSIENGQCNEYATGIYYQDKLKTPPKLNVILVHGWRQGNGRIKAIYLEPFIKNGYDMYFITLPYHTERQGNNSSYQGELMISANIERTLASIRQAVVDLRALINWLPTNRTSKVILVGISLGGLLVNLTVAVEENIDGIICVFAPNDLSHIAWNTITGKFIKKDFEDNAFSLDQLQTCWAITKTSNFATKIPKEKMLFFSALYDKYIDSKDADKLWEKWGRPKRKLYHCGHAGIALCKKSIANDSLEFIKRKILGEG